jgi:hypothetical protein
MMFLMRTRCFYRCIAPTAFAVLILMFQTEVRADTLHCPAVPEPINSGFRAYQFKGVTAAVVEWTFKSLFSNQAEVDSLVAELNVLRNKYGDVKNYHTLGVDRISPNTSIYYVGAGQERGEIFFKLVYYCEKDEWILSDRPQFHPDPDFIISQNYYLRLIKELEEAISKKGK